MKPSASRNSSAESSNSTAHWRPRSPRRASTASSSPARISRITGRDSGRKTTVRSIRLRNSGRNARVTAWETLRLREPGRSARSRGRRVDDLRAQVRGHDDHGVAEVGGLAARIAQAPVVEDLQEQVEDARLGLLELVQQHDARTAGGGSARPATRRRARRRRASAARSPGSGTRSCRAGSSGRREPNRYSASALAISVLPVPVGPTNSSTACGRVGSVSPALISATRSTMHSTASGCPITREAKNARSPSTSSRSRSSSSEAGSPERSVIVESTSLIVSGSSPGRRRRIASSSESSAPGSAASPRKWRPSASASRSTAGSVPGAACSASASVRALVHRLHPHDVERVAQLGPRAGSAARTGRARGSPAMWICVSAMPGEQQVEHAALRVLARHARVQQRLEGRRDPQHALAVERARRGGCMRPSSSPTYVMPALISAAPASNVIQPSSASRAAAPRRRDEPPAAALADHQQRLARRAPPRPARDVARRRPSSRSRRAPARERLGGAPDARDRAQRCSRAGAAPRARAALERRRRRARRASDSASASAASTWLVGDRRDRDGSSRRRDRDLAQRLQRRARATARRRARTRASRTASSTCAVERAQQEDARAARARAPAARTARAPIVSRSAGAAAAPPARPRRRARPRRPPPASAASLVLALREQLDGALERARCASSAAARRSALRQRAQSLEQLLELRSPSARPAPRRARAPPRAPCSSATSR